MAPFALARSSFEQVPLCPWLRFVTCLALDGAVRAQEWEIRLGMVEPFHVPPAARVVAGFTTQQRAVRPLALHAVLKFTVMRVHVAGRAALIRKVERQNFVRAPAGANLVAIHAGHRHVRSRQRIL